MRASTTIVVLDDLVIVITTHAPREMDVEIEPALVPSSAYRNRGGPAPLKYRSVGTVGAPYPEWVRALRGQSGVYVIRDRATREVLYVGESHSGNLYETLTRHLQQWNRWTKRSWWPGQFAESDHDPGLTYARDAVEVAARVTDLNEAVDEELRLIERLRPRDNLRGQPVEEVVENVVDDDEPIPY
jgi:hypothetical protein